MTPSAKAKMELLALKHQNGMNEDNHYTNDKVPGLIAYHKFIAGFTAGYAARDEETHGGIARELTEISPRELTLIKALRKIATTDHCATCNYYGYASIRNLARQTLESMGIPLKEGENG